jgi:two-component system, NtrC family, sensor kinase
MSLRRKCSSVIWRVRKNSATPGSKGVITVSTRLVSNWAEIRIQDTGSGIPESIRDRIFDPFFTTKEVGKGTGQGLAIAHDVIVKKHHGTINVESALGVGTTFILPLPLAAAETDTANAA